MTSLLWTQLSALVVVCQLLPSTTTLSQKKPSRYRTTMTSSSLSVENTLLWNASSTALIERETTPAVVRDSLTAQPWEKGASKSNGWRVSRKTGQSRKAKDSEATRDSLFVTTVSVMKNRDRRVSTGVLDGMSGWQLEKTSRSTEVRPIAAGEHRKPPATKSEISIVAKETASIVDHPRNPRTRTSTPVMSTTAPARRIQVNDFAFGSSAALRPTNPSEVEFSEPGSPRPRSNPAEDSSGCTDACDMSLCPQVEAESCKGRVIKDQCNCCPVCLMEPRMANNSKEGEISSKKPSYYPSNACDGMVCVKNKVCILNIQGIPMCRCPNIYSCRNGERNLLCTQNGMTFKNKCFLKVEECITGKRLRVVHRGACRVRPPPTQQPPIAPSRVPFNAPANSNARMQDGTRRKSGKNPKNAGNNWRDTPAKDETRSNENRQRKRFGNRQFA